MTWQRHSLPAAVAHNALFVIALVAIAALCSGCGGHGTGSASTPPAPANHSEFNSNRSGAVPGAGLSPVARAAVPAIQSGGTEAAATGEMGISVLQDYLNAELARLGKDPSSTASAAPQGNENAVFDLNAEIIDPDGEGGDPPTGIELTWTEQLIGDYDQNGLVNASDLTPLGANWLAEVAYDDPSLHGGFAYWPAGDPDESKSSSAAVSAASSGGADLVSALELGRPDFSPALAGWGTEVPRYTNRGYTVEGRDNLGPCDPPLRGAARLRHIEATASTGAMNWRLARIDGNRDGQLYQYDITPIAVHWQERLSHYRLYAKAPEDGGCAIIETLAPERSATAPVRCSYDAPVADEGVYAFYVAAYDDAQGEEGPPSGVVYADIVTGDINYSPVASLIITPGYGHAPQEITLDTSASYDLDGAIAAYQWDLDGDGIVDWVSTDPMPETSSDGTLSNISSSSSGVVTATYTQGSAEWFYPSVVAIDDESAQSAPASARLGICGWNYDIISSTNPELNPAWGEICFDVKAFEQSPQTGELVIAGQKDDLQEYNNDPEGVYWATRQADGSWDQQLLFGFDHPLWQAWDDSRPGARTYASGVRIAAWDAAGYPIFLITGLSTLADSIHTRIYSLERTPSGEWALSEVFRGLAPESNTQRGPTVIDDEDWGTADYAALIRDKEEYGGVESYTYHDYLFWHNEGETALDDAYWVADETNSWFTRIIEFVDDGVVVTPFFGSPEPRNRSIWWRRRIDCENWVEEEAARNTTTISDDGYYIVQDLKAHTLNQLASFVMVSCEDHEQDYYAIVESEGSELVEYPFKELGNWVDLRFMSYSPDGVVELFCWAYKLEPRQGSFIRLEKGIASKEVFYTEAIYGKYGGPRACLATSDGRLYAVIGEEGGGLGPSAEIQMFSEKLDPKV